MRKIRDHESEEQWILTAACAWVNDVRAESPKLLILDILTLIGCIQRLKFLNI